jgi:tRNA(Ile)-lysidine synthetase-like protein
LLPLEAYINQQQEGEQSFYHALPEIMKLAPLSRVCLGTYEFGEMLHVALATEPSRQLIKPPRTPFGQYPVECTISATAFSEPLVLRSYEYGDKISPAGGNFTRKLSDIFTDLKLPKEFRRSIPLLATASGKVLWLPGYAVDASVAVVPGKRSVKLTLSRYFKQTKIRI